jgi:hypothetical protein
MSASLPRLWYEYRSRVSQWNSLGLPAISPWQSLVQFRRWLSHRNKKTPLELETPWMTYSAIDYLSRVLQKEHTVFEWGIGGSSLFFARRARSVISVEHDSVWFSDVSKAMSESAITNWRGILLPPTQSDAGFPASPSDPESYRSDAPEYKNFSFHDYVSAIDKLEDRSLDMVVIDGRARPSCLKHAVSKVRVGGVLVLDNAERSYYGNGISLTDKNFTRRDFPGPLPSIPTFTLTSVFRRIS